MVFNLDINPHVSGVPYGVTIGIFVILFMVSSKGGSSPVFMLMFSWVVTFIITSFEYKLVKMRNIVPGT